MKCDELKEIMLVNQVSGERTPSGTYKKADVDEAIAEFMDENEEIQKQADIAWGKVNAMYDEISGLKARIYELESIPHTDNSAVIELLENQNSELRKQNEAIKKELAELREATRWRKVSEELPQNGQDIWAYDSKSKSVLRLEYEKSDKGEGFIVFQYKHDFFQNITQWMPFEKPKAPEETDK